MIKQYVPHEKEFISHPAPNISIRDVKFVPNATICVDAADASGVVYDMADNLCDASITYRFDGHTPIPRLTPPLFAYYA